MLMSPSARDRPPAGPPRAARAASLVAAALVASMIFVDRGRAQQEDPGARTAPAPAPCVDEAPRRWSRTEPWRGDLGPGVTRCLAVDLEAGYLVRARAHVRSPSPIGGVTVEVWGPDAAGMVERTLLLRPTIGEGAPPVPVTWEARESGKHFMVFTDFWSWYAPEQPVRARAWIDSIDPPAVAGSRRRALRSDPRVAWLREHAVPVHTVSPDDEDFGDLEPLRDALRDVRLVLLGEATHGSGTDLLAKTRLVKFLHRELGYDVLAFESGLYEMSVAWDSLRAGRSGASAFALGTWGMWTASRQMQPLIEYVARQANGSRPLRITGFDNQFLRGRASAGFPEDLARVLAGRGISSPLTESGSPERRALESMVQMRFRRGEASPPEPSVRSAVVEALRRAAAELAGSGDDEADFWREVLEGRACHARRVWAEESADVDLPPDCFRDRQMAGHLVWLARDRHPEKKIIVWAASAHAMRTDTMSAAAGPGPSMGREVAVELGEESYTIAVTSYRGTFALPNGLSPQTIVVDQHPLFEFEELMEAAGFEYAFVDLRSPAVEESWLGAPFVARPDGYRAEERLWRDVLDGLFFVRDQRRNSRAETR